MPKSMTIKIGPILHSAIRPKLSPAPSLSLLAEERPIPKAIINGTVIGPVVTPPASNATDKKFAGTNAEITKISIYIIDRITESGILNNTRSTAIVVNMPTPSATVQINT